VVLVTKEAEAGRCLKPRSSSLVNKVTPGQKKKKKKKKERKKKDPVSRLDHTLRFSGYVNLEGTTT
jgi:hypothetical protein